MKRRFLILRMVVALFCLSPLVLHAAGQVELVNTRVLWLGDSITQVGDYVTFVDYFLTKNYPALHTDFVSIGLSSETADCLSEADHPFHRPCVQDRLDQALALVKPRLVIASYGMNDGIYHPMTPQLMVSFKKGITLLVNKVTRQGASLVLLTPTPFESLSDSNLQPANAPDFSYKRPYANYDSVLTEFARWEQTLASPHVTVIDLHTPLFDYITQARATDPSFRFTADGIHPALLGHLVMAATILQAAGYHPELKATPQSLLSIQEDPLYDLVKARRETISKGWLPYVGYTREKAFKTDSIEQTTREAKALQAQIDAQRSHN